MRSRKTPPRGFRPWSVPRAAWRKGNRTVNDSIRWGVRVGFAAILAGLVGSLAVGYQSLTLLVRHGQLGGRDHESTREIEQLLSALSDAETGQRGYLLTGQEEYLEPYRSAVPRVAAHLERLEALSAGKPGQSARVAELRRVSGEKLRGLAETVQLRRERGLDAALAVVRTGRGKRAMDQARRLLAAMQGRENDRLMLHQVIQSGLSTFCLTTLLVCALILVRRDPTRGTALGGESPGGNAGGPARGPR